MLNSKYNYFLNIINYTNTNLQMIIYAPMLAIYFNYNFTYLKICSWHLMIFFLEFLRVLGFGGWGGVAWFWCPNSPFYKVTCFFPVSKCRRIQNNFTDIILKNYHWSIHIFEVFSVRALVQELIEKSLKLILSYKLLKVLSYFCHFF